jgi:D-glycero-alpha-D-manno-heptose 1-phosphate guanylyltransferase
MKEAVILAGGYGTRLKSVVSEVPKSMAQIGDHPFLYYLLVKLQRAGFNRIILAAGYLADSIQSFFGTSFNGIDLVYSVEDEPLGTGGAIYRAMDSIETDRFFVINGDTFFDVDYDLMAKRFLMTEAGLMLALKPMTDFERYGAVITDNERIISFNEKKYCSKGLINGGIYLIRKEWLNERVPASRFSFEKDVLEKFVTTGNIGYFISEGYFIDIGIPEDYRKASLDLPGLYCP